MERERNPSNRVERALKKLHHMRRSLLGDWYCRKLFVGDMIKQGYSKDLIRSPVQRYNIWLASFAENIDDTVAIFRLGRRIKNIPDIIKYVAYKTWTAVAIGAIGISRRIGPLPH